MTDEKDRSTFTRLTPMERRTFLKGLVASAVAAGAGLPVGLAALEEAHSNEVHFILYADGGLGGLEDWRVMDMS